MENKIELKSSFRAIAKRNLRYIKQARFIDKKINRLLKQEFIKFSESKRRINILIYAPFLFEANIFPFIFWLKKRRDTKMFLPFIINETFKIVPFRIPLRKNKYNIFEAQDSKFAHFNKLDLSIIPIIAVDKNFARIGFGKGMYDRFYENLKKKPTNIFVSRSLNLANAEITDKHDILGDQIIARHNLKGFYNATYNSWIPNCYVNLGRIGVFNRKKNIYARKQKHH